MEFFGITYYGSQNYFKDLLRDYYKEPLKEEETKALLQKIMKSNTCPEKSSSIDFSRAVDCYLDHADGFAYGSISRLQKMKRKGIIKPLGPTEMYRRPITSFQEMGSWQCDPDIVNELWYKTAPRYPQVMSENSKILEIVRRNGSKYTRLF